ncbi:MAG: ATP-binding protein [Myxococcota bacterium]
MADQALLLAKVRLLLIRERELMAVRQELHTHRAWMERVQRLIAATTQATTVQEAWGVLVRHLVDSSPYEFAAVVPTDGPPVTHGLADDAGLPELASLYQDRWGTGCGVMELPEGQEGRPSWLLGGVVGGGAEPVRAIVLVGRTRRTAGYYLPPWDTDREHLGYLLETLSQAIAAVRLRAALTTERNKLQIEVAEATRWLQLALDDARTARETAEASSRAKSVFLANMSHELRTPLNAIIGYSELLVANMDEGEHGDAEAARDLQRIRAAGIHLLSLISDILDLSKIEAGRMEVRITSFDLAALVRSVCATLDSLARSRSNTLVLRCPATLPIRSDDTKVRQILVNLLGNACKFTDRGVITVSLDAERDEVSLRVADTGIGMGPRLLARLFEPFHREEAAIQGRPAGSGLGLAICHQYCTLLEGSVTAQSELGRGSQFEVRLPLVARVSP